MAVSDESAVPVAPTRLLLQNSQVTNPRERRPSLANMPGNPWLKNAARLGVYPVTIALSLWATSLACDLLVELYFPLASAGVTVVVIILVMIAERRFPYRSDWNINRGDFFADVVQTNVALPVMSKSAELLLFWGTGYLLWMSGEALVGPGLVAQWPIAIQLVVLTLLAEFLYYWVHRAMHAVSVLWRFHAVHHGCERVYWANSGRFHFLDVFVSSLFYLLPFAVLSGDARLLALFYTLTAVTGILEHVNVDYRGGWLNHVFNTAQLHRFHHSLDPSEMNSNYGKVLCVWDHVFGTWNLPAEHDVEAVGLSSGRPVPNTLVGQTLYPFTDHS
jgi:sterol desaturase/sphingolipid hydroxylase (fatty acid hydroxylase superfamily)